MKSNSAVWEEQRDFIEGLGFLDHVYTISLLVEEMLDKRKV